MNYIISYKYGPPYATWWPPAPPFSPNNYPQPQQPTYRGGFGPWNVPLVHYYYYMTPVMRPIPVYGVWNPPHPKVTEVKSDQLESPVKTVTGDLKQIKNRIPNPQPRKEYSYVVVEKKKRVDSTLPPDIYDETAFPSLTRKEEQINLAITVKSIDVSSRKGARPRSLMEVNKSKDITNSTLSNKKDISNHDGLDQHQIKNKTANLKKDKVAKEILETVFEQTHQTKQKTVTNRKTVIQDKQNKFWFPENTHQVARNQAQFHWMEPRTFWPMVTNTAYIRPLKLSLSQQEIYRYMLRYVPSMILLEELGYPLVSLNNTDETVILENEHPLTANRNNNNENKTIKSPYRICDRCGNSFYMKTENTLYRKKCVYHWGKTIVPNDYKVFLTCCQRPPSSYGCTTARSHVWNGRDFGTNTNLKGFVRTACGTGGARTKIFGLDCEMCFTTEGLELVKVAIVDLAGNLVYYSLVVPENEVVDYNTRFSGVSENDYSNNKAKGFRTVQEEVLALISIDTIIIGHGLENDLRALKIIHNLVVDTSIVYPHQHGFPFRRPLKSIAHEVLARRIQEGGHNPVEDANVCVELVLRQLQKDFNIRIIPK